VKPGYHPLIAGEYLYEAGRLEEALPCLLAALQEAEAAGCPGALVPAMVHIARVRRAKGDMSGAFEALLECEHKIESMGKPHWRYLVDAFWCRLNMEAGEKEKAEEWFSSRKMGIYSEISGINEFELLVYARSLLEKGREEDAELLLKRLLHFTRNAGRLHSQAEVLTLLALAAYRKGDLPRALDALGDALAMGKEQGYFQSFLDEPALAGPLRHYIARRRRSPEALWGYAKRILSGMRSLPQAADLHAAGEKGLSLTPREKKVLELVAAAYTNAEIGAALGISIRTVKTHIGSIYAKLGVKNRAQCVKLVSEIRLF